MNETKGSYQKLIVNSRNNTFKYILDTSPHLGQGRQGQLSSLTDGREDMLPSPRRASLWTNGREGGALPAARTRPRDDSDDRHPTRMAVGSCRLRGGKRRRSGVPLPWPLPWDGSSDRRHAKTVAGVCRVGVGGATGRGGRRRQSSPRTDGREGIVPRTRGGHC